MCLPLLSCWSSDLTGLGGLDLGFRELMFTYEVLNEVIFSEALVRTIAHITLPPLELAMSFILMSNPVSFAFEGFGICTGLKCASEGLNIFVNMLRPVRRFVKFLDLEAQRTFEFRR